MPVCTCPPREHESELENVVQSGYYIYNQNNFGDFVTRDTVTMRITSVELHQKLGQTIDRARIEPVVVTKHDREHVVILSAERYALLEKSSRRARLTSSITAEERALFVAAEVPSDEEQKRSLAEFAAAVAELKL